jgi:hypothetical protein
MRGKEKRLIIALATIAFIAYLVLACEMFLAAFAYMIEGNYQDQGNQPDNSMAQTISLAFC